MNRSVYLCAFLAIVFTTLFVLDLLGYFTSVTNPIASLVRSEGTVRRLVAHELSWDRARVGTLFAAKDTVATGEQGWAKLQFDAGGEVELEPGSMVTLSDSPEAFKLRFITGGGKVRLVKKTKKKVVVTQQKKKKIIKVEPKSFGEKKPEGPIRIEVVESLAKVGKKIPKKKKAMSKLLARVMKEEAVRKTTKPLVVKKEKLPNLAAPEVVFPLEGETFEMAAGKSRYIRWKATKAKRYEVIVKPAKLEAKAKVVKTKRTRVAVPVKKPGRYLWAVRGLTKAGERGPTSDYRYFEIKSLEVAKGETQKATKRMNKKPEPAAKPETKEASKAAPSQVLDKPQIFPVIVK